MQTVLYLSITETISFAYEKELLQFVKIRFPSVIVYDVDNHSDSLTLRYAMDLLNQTSQSILIIEATEAPLGSLRGILEKVIEQKAKCRVLFSGKNAMAERMLGLLGVEQLRKNISLEAQQEALVEWLG